MSVIAEGVESQAQFDLLKVAQCDQVQGYLINKPLSVPEITTLFRSNSQLLQFRA